MTKIKNILEYLIASVKRMWYDLGNRRVMEKMRTKYNAMDIAQWFLWYNDYQKNVQLDADDIYDVYEGITHLKVQNYCITLKEFILQ